MKRTKHSMSRLFALATPLALTLGATYTSASYAEVPPVDAIGRPAVVLCELGPNGEPVRAVHQDKIVFRITGELTAAIDADQPALDAIPMNTKLDIKVLDNPQSVADLEGKVLTFLGALDNAANRADIVIDNVLYAVVCPNPETSD